MSRSLVGHLEIGMNFESRRSGRDHAFGSADRGHTRLQAGQSADPDGGFWPERRTSVLDWLVNDTRGERFLDNIFRNCCVKLRAQGIPIARASMHLRPQHPQWFGSRVLWRPDLKDAELHPIELGINETERYHLSPVGALHAGAAQVRRRLEEASDDQDSRSMMSCDARV
jgi:adenylate cyclase